MRSKRLRRPDDLSPAPDCERRSAGRQMPLRGILRGGAIVPRPPKASISNANICKLLKNVGTA